MKADRQIGILSILLQQERITAPELAEKFEVSRRTINRDIETLCRAGIPICTFPGSGGGISIMEGYRMDRTLLTSKDMRMILAGLRSLDSVSGSRYYEQLMEKLKPGASDFVSGTDSILIDLSSWYKESLAPKISVIQDAVEERKQIAFHYYAPSGDSIRMIEPYYSTLIDEISYTLLDCVQKEEVPEMESISEVSVKHDDTADMVYKENSGYCYSDAYTYFIKDGKSWINLDNEKTEDTFTTLSEVSWEACVDYYAEDSELSSYGLENPSASVSVTYIPPEDEDDENNSDKENKNEKFEYEIGTANDAYYAKLKDSNIIYSISEEVYNAAVNASYEELKPDEVVLLDWDTVESIEVEYDGNIYTVDVESDGEDGYNCTFNDKEVDFQDVLDQISAITVAEESDEEEEDENKFPDKEPELNNNKAELSLTFHRNTDEYSTVELDFYQYDGSYCISVLNGDEMNYTDRSSVVDLKEAVNSVILDSETEE